MLAAADSQYYDLLDKVSTAVFTGCRRSFVLIDYQDIAEVSTAAAQRQPEAGGHVLSEGRGDGC